MVNKPDNRYVKKFGYQYGLNITDPQNHMDGQHVFDQYSYTKKEKSKFSLQQGESGRVEMNNDRSIDIVAGANGEKANILVHNRNGTIDISVGENGEVRVNAQQVEFHADDVMKFDARKISMVAKDEFALEAPWAHSDGFRGNLVPKTFLDKVTSGTFVGGDILGKLKDTALGNLKGLDIEGKLGGVLESAGPQLENLSKNLGDITKDLDVGGLTESLNSNLSGITGQLEGMSGQLEGIAGNVAPQLQNFAQGPGANFGAQLKSNKAFANFGKGLQGINIPKGF